VGVLSRLFVFIGRGGRSGDKKGCARHWGKLASYIKKPQRDLAYSQQGAGSVGIWTQSGAIGSGNRDNISLGAVDDSARGRVQAGAKKTGVVSRVYRIRCVQRRSCASPHRDLHERESSVFTFRFILLIHSLLSEISFFKYFWRCSSKHAIKSSVFNLRTVKAIIKQLGFRLGIKIVIFAWSNP